MIAPAQQGPQTRNRSRVPSLSNTTRWIEEHRFSTELRFDRLGVEQIEVGVEVHGPSDGPPVVVLGGISAHRHLCPTPTDPRGGWWPGMVGPGLPLDTRRYRIIGIDYVGGVGTRGPDGSITTADQARLVVAVLDRLGVARASWVGASYGGMVALVAAASQSRRVATLLVACAAHRPHPMATALRVIQRSIVERGRSLTGNEDESALVLARALAMTTYRSASEFESRFQSSADWSSGRPVFPVESYLKARGQSFAQHTSATSFLRLSESIDCHAIDPAMIDTPTALLSVDTDAVVPEFLADELAELAPGVHSHVKIRSLYGHDAFLKEIDAVGMFIQTGLARVEGVGLSSAHLKDHGGSSLGT